jgi:hypothetical protein
MPSVKSRPVSPQPSAAAFRALVRRVSALEHRLTPRRGPRSLAFAFGEADRRSDIMDAEFLRQSIEREEALRKENPSIWRQIDERRRARNRENAALNRPLRAAGLRPVRLQLSLGQMVKKLQRLEARRRTESASSRTSK